MPYNEVEIAYLASRDHPSSQGLQHDHQRLEELPEDNNKIGKWTLMCLILNRTIGSGIFLTPHRILAGTGCVGGALFIWVLGAIISICGLYVWLECGLSMPQRRVSGEEEPRGVPRSGGEKNFLEFMFPDKQKAPDAPPTHIRTTCSFAIMFMLMYNLSGNAMSFAIQALVASGAYDPATDSAPARSTTIGIAIAALSLVVLAHIFSRGVGIKINNAFAIVKVSLLLLIIILGIAKAAGALGGSSEIASNNFTKNVWTTQRKDPVSWSNSILLCMYCFSGYEQPFYVLAETKTPKKLFPKYTVLALVIAIVLFLLVNISYLLVVDTAAVLSDPFPNRDLATLFFDRMFQGNRRSAERAMAALIATSIFGNLWVMTFTAARVKQEIAKEGILPYSLQIATSYTTPYGMLQKWRKADVPGQRFEQAPTAAFALHWFTSVLLIAVTAAIADPRKAYSALISLYSYTVILVLGCWVSVGLLLIKHQRNKWRWQQRRRYRPWLSPIHAIIYAVATTFLLVTAFLPPQRGSPFHESISGIPWYIVPTIGITGPLWGLIWYCGILARERIVGRRLVVTREAYWEQDPADDGEYIEKAEIINHGWRVPPKEDMTDAFSMESGQVGGAAASRHRHNGDADGESIRGPERANIPAQSSRGGAAQLSDSFDG